MLATYIQFSIFKQQNVKSFETRRVIWFPMLLDVSFLERQREMNFVHSVSEAAAGSIQRHPSPEPPQGRAPGPAVRFMGSRAEGELHRRAPGL